jgi:hypothetical protein
VAIPLNNKNPIVGSLSQGDTREQLWMDLKKENWMIMSEHGDCHNNKMSAMDEPALESME